MVARKEDEIKAVIPNVDGQEEYQNLLSLVYKQGSYWLYHCKSLQDETFKNHTERVWRIVKYENYLSSRPNVIFRLMFHPQYLKLKLGDIIKFGRVRFQIKQLVVDLNDINSSSKNNNSDDSPGSKPSRHADSSQVGNLRSNLTTIENEPLDMDTRGYYCFLILFYRTLCIS